MTDVVDLTHSSTSSGSVIMVSSRGLSLERAAGEPEAGLDQMKLDCTRLKGDVEELATRVPQVVLVYQPPPPPLPSNKPPAGGRVASCSESHHVFCET